MTTVTDLERSSTNPAIFAAGQPSTDLHRLVKIS
jgi:hypothetical protein